jgi:uncharacterized protein
VNNLKDGSAGTQSSPERANTDLDCLQKAFQAASKLMAQNDELFNRFVIGCSLRNACRCKLGDRALRQGD